jgi:hypothetical protein
MIFLTFVVPTVALAQLYSQHRQGLLQSVPSEADRYHNGDKRFWLEYQSKQPLRLSPGWMESQKGGPVFMDDAAAQSIIVTS